MSILFSQSSSSLALPLKIIFISTSVLSAAVLLKLSAPAIADFAVTDVPSFYNVVVSWLRPPYLYLVINCIIVTIVASSKLQSKLGDVSLSPSPTPPLMTTTITNPPVTVAPQPMVIFPETVKHYDYDAVTVNRDALLTVKLEDQEVNFEFASSNFIRSGLDQFETRVSEANKDFVDLNPAVKFEGGVFEHPAANNFVSKGLSDYETKFFIADKSSGNMIMNAAPAPRKEPDIYNFDPEVSVTKSSPSPSPIGRRDSSDFSFSNEKPPVSKRIGHRRAVRSSPEGGKAALGVSKAKKQDTLESTWKTITEGRAMPLARHLRKADTWETHGGRHHNQTPENQKMTKSETFKDRTNNSILTQSPGSGKLKKESSLGQDELNRRVEAFIKKFNEDMRLQRQESLKQYREMINRGAHQ